MQIIIEQRVIKVHCSAKIIVSVFHPRYTDEQIERIRKPLSRACRTKSGLRLNGWTIKASKKRHGWFYIKRTEILGQAFDLMGALIRHSAKVPSVDGFYLGH